MQIKGIVAGLVLAAVTLPAPAQPNSADGNNPVGKVETIYVREGKWLYFEKKLMRKIDGRELWAEVRFEHNLRDNSTGELGQLPANSTVQHGDLVATKIAGPMPGNLPLLPEVTHVTSVVARHDTLQAMVFGLPGYRPTKSASVEAQACTGLYPTYLTLNTPDYPR